MATVAKLAAKTSGADFAFCVLSLAAIHMNHSDCYLNTKERDVHLEEALGKFRESLRIAILTGDLYIRADAVERLNVPQSFLQLSDQIKRDSQWISASETVRPPGLLLGLLGFQTETR